MTKIEKIERITAKSQPESFLIQFNNGETLKCYLSEIADFSLHAGMEIEDLLLENLKASASFTGCKNRAALLLGRSMMSRGELVRKLTEKGENASDASAAAEWLAEYGLLDETHYAKTIVIHYAGKAYGRAKIRDELKKRRIPRELWEEAFEGFEESDAIDRYIEKKLRGTEPDRAEVKKLSDALYRRGYSWGDIKDALRRYSEDMTSEELQME